MKAHPRAPAYTGMDGRRVTIMGLGLFGGGGGAARFFARRGADVIVADQRDETALRPAIAALAGLPITYRLGPHDEADFRDTELLVVNPAVVPESPFLQVAVAAGVPLETEINIFMRLCRAPIAGVTGSNGKSTTTALLAAMLRETGRQVWAGGNLGGSLLDSLDRIGPDDRVVLELSSFQLERLAWIERSPHAALVTNLTPNHLDRHGTLAAYAEAKKPVLRYQRPGNFAVLNRDDAIVSTWPAEAATGAHVLTFGTTPLAPKAEGALLEGDALRLRLGGGEATVSLAGLRLAGSHNRMNAAGAATAAFALAATTAQIEAAAAKFEALEHRLQLVGQFGGVAYYNDSKATTPESTIIALRSFDPGRIIILVGGHDKKLPYDEMGRQIVARARHAIVLGQAADVIEQAIRAAGGDDALIRRAADFEDAVRQAIALARPGDAVVLSPACASYDMFRNYEERGRRFSELVRQYNERP